MIQGRLPNGGPLEDAGLFVESDQPRQDSVETVSRDRKVNSQDWEGSRMLRCSYPDLKSTLHDGPYTLCLWDPPPLCWVLWRSGIPIFG